MSSIRFFWVSSWLVGYTLLSGCGHSPTVDPAVAPSSQAAEQALAMVGRPYRYGGNTPQGFDCSGLVQYSYARVGVRLPRSTRELLRASRSVPRKQLRRGDLLFFDQEGKRSSHVAIYLGNGRFVHAPSSGKNVHVAGFNDAYWQRHFTEARRVVVD